MEMLPTQYMPRKGPAGLLNLKKTGEKFLRNEHSCGYVIECEPGFGHTVGVALRRTILSAIGGISVVAMKINNAQQIFASVPGIKSSVLDISLKLQKIAFRPLDSDFEFCILNLKKKADENGGIVYAGDFEKNSSVVIVNGDLPICELDNNGTINLSIMIGVGIGYTSFADHDIKNLPDGWFTVDSYFNSRTKVGYTVEFKTSGKRYDEVTLDITTDGSISPDQILKAAGEKLYKIFEPLSSAEIKDKNSEDDENSEEKIFAIKIDDCGELSPRSIRCLIENNILTIEELVTRTEGELRSLKGFGEKSLVEVKEFLASFGLLLGKKITKKRKI